MQCTGNTALLILVLLLRGWRCVLTERYRFLSVLQAWFFFFKTAFTMRVCVYLC